MTVQISGILPNPFGEPCPKAKIRFTAVATEGGVLQGSDAEERTDKLGAYSFSLTEGRYLLEILYSDEYKESGIVLVDEATPSPLTLQDLIKYTTPYNPPLANDTPADWLNLFEGVLTNPDWNFEHEQQVRNEATLVNTDKTISQKNGEYLAKETHTTATDNTKSVNQSLAYKDVADREAAYNKTDLDISNISASTGSEVYTQALGEEGNVYSHLETSQSSSKHDQHITDTNASSEMNETVGDLSAAIKQQVDATSTTTSSEVSSGSASVVTKKVIDANALVTALLEQGVIVENVEAFDRLTVTADKSVREIQVDEFKVGDAFEVDTVNDVVQINGQLKIGNGDDYKGPVGDSQFYEYAYATTEEKNINIWHIDNPDDPYDVPADSVVWRKHRMVTIIEGVRTEGTWSEPYLLTGEDGAEGDTLYWVYLYSPSDVLTDPSVESPVGWHSKLQDGDLYRIERLKSNGIYQGVWSEPAKIAGADGDDGELVFEEYMYSPYGTSTPSSDTAGQWHTNFTSGDFYRSSRVVKYAAGTPIPVPSDAVPILVTAWTTPALISPRKGFEYADGLSQIVVHLYIRSTSAPALPTDTLTYNFADFSLTGNLAGWATEIPGGNGNLWLTVATASSNTGTDDIAPNEWTSPQISSTQAYNQATLSLYKRSSSGVIPDAPSSTLSYDFTTGVLTGNLEGWSNGTIPSGTDDLYIATAAVRSQTDTADIEPDAWGVGILTSTAFRQQTVNIYRRGSDVRPGSDVLYNFTDGSVLGLTDWSLSIPPGDEDVFIGVAVASAAGTSDVIEPADWSIGPLGTSGHQAAVINLYQSGTDKPAEPVNEITYDFTQGKVITDVSPWSTSVPENTQGKIYVTTATANTSALVQTDVIPVGEWTDPQVVLESGINAVPVNLYRKYTLDSVPDKHTNTLTYSFDTAGLVNQPDNSWHEYPMSVNLGEAVWSMTATAQGLASASTDTIEPDEFSEPVIYTATGSEVFTVFEYAENETGPWYSEFTPERVWRRQATSVNGLVGDWSNPVKLTGEDGSVGDTIYVDYNYSPDLSEWHPTLEDGDIWRRERIVTNGSAGAWTSPARLKGNEQYIEYQYATTPEAGEAGWHSNFTTGDYFRRERAVVNGVPQAWSDATQIVPLKGVDFDDGISGDTIYEVYQYSDDGVTNWEYDFEDHHVYRRTAVVTNGALGPWSDPAKLSGIDGADGDTIYVEYEYSADTVNWHPEMQDGDLWRHERIHTVGVTVPTDPWSNRTRIRGVDGSYYEYLYNADADNYPTTPNDAYGTWHTNFSEGDYYRIERLVQESSTSDWTTPTKLKPKKGEDYNDGIEGPKGEDGVTTYTWIRYADDANGSNMSDSPLNKPYLGIASNKTVEQESNNPDDYTWSKVEGDQGIQGENGYMWIQYSNYDDGLNGTTPAMDQDPVDSSTGRPYMYIGIAYNKITPTEGGDPTDYTWSKYVGDEIFYEYSYSPDKISWDTTIDANDIWRRERRVENGYYGDWSEAIRMVGTEGPQGIKGDTGNPGADGESLYTWVRYADDEFGNGISNNPTNKKYIGFAYNKDTPTESNNKNDYTWSLSQGGQGIEGPAGADGTPRYTWIKYSPFADGASMTDEPEATTKYLGISPNQIDINESSNPNDYTWSAYVGSNGQYYEDEFSVAGNPNYPEDWHYPAFSRDRFKRTRLIDMEGNPVVDSTTDTHGWVYTQIVPIKDVDFEDGNSADTIFEVYQYSVNGTDGWHDEFDDADNFRRTAVVLNGSQSAWSAPARISGRNGIQTNIITLYQVKTQQYTWLPQELIQTDETYNIITGSFVDYDTESGINGWMVDVPAVISEGDALYQVRAAALSEAGQLEVDVPADDWAAPVQITASGVSGEPGKNGAGSYILNWEDTYNEGNGYSNLITDIVEPLTEGYVEYWFTELSTRASQAGDILTVQQPELEDAVPAQWLRNDTEWESFTLVIDGSAIVNGTLAAESLKSETSITDILYVASNASRAELTLSGSGGWSDGLGNVVASSDYRQWVGDINPASAPYYVKKNGEVYMSKLTADNAVVKGHIEASSGTFKGRVEADSGYFNGDVYVENLQGDVNELFVKAVPQNFTNTSKTLILYTITIPPASWDRKVVLPGISIFLVEGTIKCRYNGTVIKSYSFSSGLAYSLTSQVVVDILSGDTSTTLEISAVGSQSNIHPLIYAEQDAVITTFKA